MQVKTKKEVMSNKLHHYFLRKVSENSEKCHDEPKKILTFLEQLAILFY